MNYKILMTCDLSKKTNSNSVTKHFVGNVNINESISMLKIVSYPNTKNEFYLIYCSDNGDDLTDTYHESIEQAINQANFEFGVSKEDWIKWKK